MENRALESLRSQCAGSSCERVRGSNGHGEQGFGECEESVCMECGKVLDGEQGFGEFENCKESMCRECREVMDGEHIFGEFEECEESVCREFQ
jgi:hypothetical protein